MVTGGENGTKQAASTQRDFSGRLFTSLRVRLWQSSVSESEKSCKISLNQPIQHLKGQGTGEGGRNKGAGKKKDSFQNLPNLFLSSFSLSTWLSSLSRSLQVEQMGVNSQNGSHHCCSGSKASRLRQPFSLGSWMSKVTFYQLSGTCKIITINPEMCCGIFSSSLNELCKAPLSRRAENV